MSEEGTTPNEGTQEPNYTDPAKQQRDQMLASVKQGVESGALTLPEKFQGDPEKFVDSYLELEKKLHQPQENQPSATELTTGSPESGTAPSYGSLNGQDTQDTSTSGQSDTDSQQPSDWTDLTGDGDENKDKQTSDLNAVWGEVQKELQTTGKVSDETVKKHNLPEQMVNQLVRSHEATKQADKQKAVEQAGSEERLNEVMNWAKTKLPAEEKKKIQEMLSGPNWSVALDALMARHARENGRPANINVSAPQGSGAKPWGSMAEKQAHYNDPRYRTDPTFRQHVIERERETMQRMR